MTADDWQGAYDPLEMIEALSDSERQRWWWFIILCLDEFGEHSTADLIRRANSGGLSHEELSGHRASLSNRAGLSGGGRSLGHRPIHLSEDAQKARAGLAALEDHAFVEGVTKATSHRLQRLQCAWLRCLYPNPFRPAHIDPSWLTSTVRTLAQGIYAERAFDRLPILSDALQDAGCTDEDILSHLRSDGPHVKGCWPIDLLLGKE